MANNSAAFNSAIRVDGGISTTVKMQNSAQAKPQLVMTLTADATPRARICVLPGRDTVVGANVAGITHVFRDWVGFAEFKKYAEVSKFVVSGVEVSTTDTDNFIGGNGFLMFQRSITGKKSEEIYTYFEDYKVDNGGGGYNKTLKIPASDFSPVVTPLMTLGLISLKANTSMTFKFNIPFEEISMDGSKIENIKL